MWFSRVVVAAALASFQEPAPIRVSVTVVQVDAYVTDSAGNPVTNLTRDDFEVIENGQPRRMTFAEYQRVAPAPRPAAAALTPGMTAPPRLHPRDVRRTIALIVDDLKMSFESLHFARRALHEFLDQQVGEGDLISIAATSGRLGVLQNFTTDRRMLKAAIDKLQFQVDGSGSRSLVAALNGQPEADGQFGVRANRFAAGSFNAIAYAIAGMREMPGRKSMILFSDGFATRSRTGQEPQVNAEEVRGVTERANRAQVVINAVDVRGVIYPGLQAADLPGELEQDEVRGRLDERNARLRDSQDGLRYLVEQTGGRAVVNSNDLAGEMGKVMAEQGGFYLLGFARSEDEAPGGYRRLVVRVKPAGLRVRARRGYYGEAGSAAPDEKPAERLRAALRSPLAQEELPVRFSPTVTVSAKGAPGVRGLVYLDGRRLTFGPVDAEGRQTAVIHIVAVTEGESGVAAASTERTYRLRLVPEAVERMRREGWVYAFDQELKKPGGYQVRVAVMDEASGRIGAETRYVEVPGAGQGRTVLSGITMGAGSGDEAAWTHSVAARRFVRGRPIEYGVTVFGAPAGMEIQPRILREGQVVWTGRALAAGKGDGRQAPAAGTVTLGERSAPGEYVLTLEAVDPRTRRVLGAQWIDFTLE